VSDRNAAHDRSHPFPWPSRALASNDVTHFDDVSLQAIECCRDRLTGQGAHRQFGPDIDPQRASQRRDLTILPLDPDAYPTTFPRRARAADANCATVELRFARKAFAPRFCCCSSSVIGGAYRTANLRLAMSLVSRLWFLVSRCSVGPRSEAGFRRRRSGALHWYRNLVCKNSETRNPKPETSKITWSRRISLRNRK
jgi:hypothetical protein